MNSFKHYRINMSKHHRLATSCNINGRCKILQKYNRRFIYNVKRKTTVSNMFHDCDFVISFWNSFDEKISGIENDNKYIVLKKDLLPII